MGHHVYTGHPSPNPNPGVSQTPSSQMKAALAREYELDRMRTEMGANYAIVSVYGMCGWAVAARGSP
jgi:hypothetical protein